MKLKELSLATWLSGSRSGRTSQALKACSGPSADGWVRKPTSRVWSFEFSGLTERARPARGVKRLAVELDEDGGTPNLRWYNNRSDWGNWISVLNTYRLLEAA